jgi:hypothetical protein
VLKPVPAEQGTTRATTTTTDYYDYYYDDYDDYDDNYTDACRDAACASRLR